MLATITDMESASHENANLISLEKQDFIKSSIMRCVGRGLSKLGESGGFAVEYILKAEFGLPLEQIPEAPDKFVSVLRNLFGLGAKVLEEYILEELFLVESHSRECNCQIRRFAKVVEDDLRRERETGIDVL